MQQFTIFTESIYKELSNGNEFKSTDTLSKIYVHW